MRSEILWAARYGSLFATHQSTKQLNFVADGCIWMSDFALAKVSVFSNLPIVFSEMVLCFVFPTSRDLHANTFRELSEVYADLIRHAGFHFPTTGNFTLCKEFKMNCVNEIFRFVQGNRVCLTDAAYLLVEWSVLFWKFLRIPCFSSDGQVCDIDLWIKP